MAKKFAALIGIAVMINGSGCQTLAPQGRRDINRVSTFYNTQHLWLNFDSPPTHLPQGIKFSVFLTARDSELGVFGDGIMQIEMFRIDKSDSGEQTRTPVKKWSFDTQQAQTFRGRQRKRYGWGYGFRLNWENAEVRGHEIMIIVSFHRHDGTIIHGQPKYLKVPENVFPERG